MPAISPDTSDCAIKDGAILPRVTAVPALLQIVFLFSYALLFHWSIRPFVSSWSFIKGVNREPSGLFPLPQNTFVLGWRVFGNKWVAVFPESCDTSHFLSVLSPDCALHPQKQKRSFYCSPTQVLTSISPAPRNSGDCIAESPIDVPAMQLGVVRCLASHIGGWLNQQRELLARGLPLG